uniref:Fibronectin type-III domain-containing protein n=1 Tax=Plectus sambesii TaxID=2011161 RepID=A0A914VEU2_9BILA
MGMGRPKLAVGTAKESAPLEIALLSASGRLLDADWRPEAAKVVAKESKVPGPPQNVQVKTSSEEATLWWDPPANADEVLVRGYTLSYGIGTPSLTTVIEGVDSNAFTINFLEPNTSYVFALTAYNEAATEDSQKVLVTAKTLPAKKQPDHIFDLFAPTNVQANVLSSTEVELTWSDPDKA